jgi:hypothetical protein
VLKWECRRARLAGRPGDGIPPAFFGVWRDAPAVVLRLRLLLQSTLLFRFFGVADGVGERLRPEEHESQVADSGLDVRVLQLRRLLCPRSEVQLLADRLGVSSSRLRAVGVAVNVRDLGGGMLIVESPSGATVQMRRVPVPSLPVCAVPTGLSGPVVAFT